MSFKGLTNTQGFSLLFEMTSARQLLAQGHELLLSDQAVDAKLDAVLTCLSIGTEKMLKILVGVSALHDDLPWPNLKGYLHDPNALDETLRERLDTWMLQEPRTEYLTELHSSLVADPLWIELRSLLSNYGSRARFFHLDSLGNKPQEGDSPSGHWITIENMAIERTPHLRGRDLGSMSTTEFAEYLRGINGVIARSLVRWWFTTTRLGRHGALGEDAIRICADIEPQNALPCTDFQL
ncbi:hypothetical protein [Timonella senegalensis]|uniref:hypothetical protein n=1 Tax=Timonella senegalensis TaxID=1465825 RepID=UPI0028A5A451|nr:hypothetical protein [Timonella senegalensis]